MNKGNYHYLNDFKETEIQLGTCVIGIVRNWELCSRCLMKKYPIKALNIFDNTIHEMLICYCCGEFTKLIDDQNKTECENN